MVGPDLHHVVAVSLGATCPRLSSPEGSGGWGEDLQAEFGEDLGVAGDR